MRPHRRQPTRLPGPWDSPGKNTGVGCHFLLKCMKVKSESEVAQSCPTPSDPMDCSLPGSSVRGIFQARVLEWGAIAFSPNNNQITQTGHSISVIFFPGWTNKICWLKFAFCFSLYYKMYFLPFSNEIVIKSFKRFLFLHFMT